MEQRFEQPNMELTSVNLEGGCIAVRSANADLLREIAKRCSQSACKGLKTVLSLPLGLLEITLVGKGDGDGC